VVDAISDTGPVQHLHEIGQIAALAVFDHIIVPDLVAEELRLYGLEPANLGVPKITVSIITVESDRWSAILAEQGITRIQPADPQVVVLAGDETLGSVVLADDLALRRTLEGRGVTVVGSIGILVRAYSLDILDRAQLIDAVDALFTASTLYTSRAFQAYARRLLADLP
jgi:predicted nucleic acid-binding protein